MIRPTPPENKRVLVGIYTLETAALICYLCVCLICWSMGFFAGSQYVYSRCEKLVDEHDKRVDQIIQSEP